MGYKISAPGLIHETGPLFSILLRESPNTQYGRFSKRPPIKIY